MYSNRNSYNLKGIQFSNYDVVPLTELVPDRSELLAVAAPWGVELY